jgi:serine/arginine repetitive matrix protein 2
MFGRNRKRASSNPVDNLHHNPRPTSKANSISTQAPHPPPSSSASLAATKAFMRSHDSNGALSSSAAAAALRTHTTSPTPVGQIVTKRMARKGSVSSQGSNSQQAPALRRHSSSGSMTERTFRDPSPSRSSPIDHDAPPVPKLPQDVPGLGAVHRRASSLEPSYRGGSPVGRGGGRGVSLDRGVSATPGRGHPRVSNLSQVLEDDQYGNQQSVNFSRPISPAQTNSPKSAASARGGHSGWFGGPVVNPDATFRGAKPRAQKPDGYSAFDAHSTRQEIQNAANRPVSSNKAQISHGFEGARLASGSLRAKQNPHVAQTRQSQTAPSVRQEAPRIVNPNSPYAVYDPSTRTFIHKQDAMAMHRAISDAEEPLPRYEQHHRETPQQQPERQHQPQPIARRFEPQNESRFHEQGYEVTPAPVNVPARAPPALHPLHGTFSAKQPSKNFTSEDIRHAADANTSRKLDFTVATDIDVVHENAQSPKFASNQDSSFPHIGPAAVATTASADAHAPDSIRSERNHSLSPPRNAHFAPAALELPNDIKHQPLPRSVSPAKSALKSSPSVSRRGHSPLANDGRTLARGPASEASDAVSDDGNKKKKRTVRVSFDEDPVIAGTSAYADTENPTSQKGLASSKWSSVDSEQDLDDFMRPRPVLPSFGSVRDKDRRPHEGDAPEKVTETVSSSLSNSAISAPEPIESSTDHNVGGILAQEHASKKAIQAAPQDPLPPEVTSVEGSGYVSDSDQSETSGHELPMHTPDETQRTSELAQSTPKPEPKTLTAPVESQTSAPEIPVIAVQPASPFEKPEPKFQRPFLPGGWDDDEGSDTEIGEKSISQPEAKPTAISFANIEAHASQYADAESTDNDSIYSDAYEDLSEVEDGAFQSIDAILESPTSGSPPGLMASKFADTNANESPKSTTRYDNLEDTKSVQMGDSSDIRTAAGQNGSAMGGSRKQQEPPETPVKATTPTAKTVVAAKMPVQPKPVTTSDRGANMKPVDKTSKPASQPRKSALKKTTVAPQLTAQPEPPRIKKTMRETQAFGNMPSNQPQMKKSMRANTDPSASAPDTHMRKTMRGTDSVVAYRGPVGLAASRHSMPPVDTKPPRGALQKRNIPAAVAASNASRPRPQSAIVPASQKFTPAPTYDSDSDASASSFQRSRPRASRKQAGQYTMRGSMRGAPAPTMRTAPAPTMRPTSPAQTRSPAPTMKRSMRPSSPTVEAPVNAGVRSSKFSIRSLSPAGRFRPKSSMDNAPPLPIQTSSPKKTSMFGKSSKAKAPSVGSAKPRHKSRFADSSDEDDDRPSGFQSRFVDSDSDDDFELPPGLAPVRGIPTRPGEEDRDSTDLEEELSDVEPSAKAIEKGSGLETNGATNGTTNGQDSRFVASSLRQSKHATELPEIEAAKKAKPKRGFFGLGKKKAAASYIEADAEAPNTASTEIPMPPQHRRDPSRPLTPIGEDKDVEANSPRPRSPKLQRRSTPQWGRSASDSWPLPQPPKLGEDARPQSSDGVMNRRTSFRPPLGKRNSSQISQARTMVDPSSGKEVIVGRTGKKKKFQGLRRVFGLHD